MIRRILAVVAGLALTACGDNTRACGPGTDEVAGVCLPTGDAPPTCGPGTHLDPVTNTCQVDMSACQDGTVLVHGACVDPTTGAAIDYEEGVEPNGLGLGGEPSGTPAGLVTLRPAGAPGVVLHGHITPVADRDDDGLPEPDYDTYVIDVAAPALVRITADGVHGLDAGFMVVSDADRLDSWVRYGVNNHGDTARREVYFPAQGRYAIAIADARSISLGSAAGDATSEYYVTIDQLAIPAADPVPAGPVMLDPEAVQLYTAAMGSGLNEARVDVPGEPGLVIASATRVANTGEASVLAGGFAAGDTATIAVDQIINTAIAPLPATLTVTPHDAAALFHGGTQPEVSATPAVIGDLAQFAVYAFGGAPVLLDLHWNTEVDGVLVDDRGRVVSPFSWDPQLGGAFGLLAGFGDATWHAFTGLFVAPAPGTYYLLVYDPFGAPGDPLVATGSVTPASNGNASDDTSPINWFFEMADPDPWQRFTLSGLLGGAGTLEIYDQDTTSGRLSPLSLTSLFGGGTTIDPGEGVPLVSVSATVNSTGAAGRIMLGGPQRLLGVVTLTSASGDVFEESDLEPRTDFGTLTAGQARVLAGESFGFSPTRKLYLLRTAPSNVVTVTVHPTGATLDAQIASLAADESVLSFADDKGASGDETLVVVADARGYVALEVTALAGLDPYDLSVEVAAPYYAQHTSATAWANACTGGTDITPADRDDGLTAPIALPAGFTRFGAAAAHAIVSTNGWLTFDTATPVSPAASRNEQPVPSAAGPNDLVAAYWDDLDQVRICTKQVGAALVVQWRGVLFRDPSVTIAAQAILDPADDSVEIVYAPYHAGTGASASAGIEDAAGALGTAIVPGTSTKLTHP